MLNAQGISTEESENVTFIDAGIITELTANDEEQFDDDDDVEDVVLIRSSLIVNTNEAPKKRSKVMTTVFALLAIAFVGTLAVSGFRHGSDNNDSAVGAPTSTTHSSLGCVPSSRHQSELQRMYVGDQAHGDPD